MTDHERLVADVFGIRGDYTPLPGEIDENAKVTGSDGRDYLLRISPPDTDVSALRFRQSVLEAVADIDVATPTVIPAVDESTWAILDDGRTAHLYSWVDGMAYSEAGRPPELAHQIGVVAGRILTRSPTSRRDPPRPASSGICRMRAGSSGNAWGTSTIHADSD